MEKIVMTGKKGRTLSIILYIIGVLTALIFAGSILWANFELPFYFDYSYASVGSENQTRADLNCPVLLTTKETGTIRMDITNKTDKTLKPVLRGEISYLGGITREFEFNPTILPGESSPVEIKVNSDDIVFNFMIMVRTFQLPTYKTPSEAGSCAIVMAPIPFFSGDQVYYITLIFIPIMFIAGISLWVKNNRPIKGLARSVLTIMVLLAILLLTAIVFGIIDGFVIPGFLLLVLIVILIMVAIIYFLSSPQVNEN